MAAFNHMLNRLNNIPMGVEDYKQEFNTILYIASQNGYSGNLIHQLNSKIKNRLQLRNLTSFYTPIEDKKKYITLEYNNIFSHKVNKILIKYNYVLAHKTSQKLQQKLRFHHHTNEHDSGIYKLVCNNCPKFYIGQTGRSFTIRFAEHIHEAKNAHNNNNQRNIKSNYALHLVSEKHTYTDINSNMKILHRMRKGNTMDRIEEFEIYKHRNNPSLLNDKINTKTNKIYEMILYNERSKHT